MKEEQARRMRLIYKIEDLDIAIDVLRREKRRSISSISMSTALEVLRHRRRELKSKLKKL